MLKKALLANIHLRAMPVRLTVKQRFIFPHIRRHIHNSVPKNLDTANLRARSQPKYTQERLQTSVLTLTLLFLLFTNILVTIDFAVSSLFVFLVLL